MAHRRKRSSSSDDGAASAPERAPSAPAPALPPLVSVVGGNSVTTAMVLACLNTADATVLRRLHPAMAAAVAEVPWADMVTVVRDTMRWHAALPAAVGLRSAAMPTEHDAVLAHLTSLDLSLASSVTVSLIAALPPSLRSLSVRAYGVDLGSVSFTHLPALESLTWGVTDVSGVGGLPPSLRELRINGSILAADTDFSHLRSLRLLHNASEHSELSAATIASLQPSLEELDVSYRGFRRFFDPAKAGEWPPSASLAHLPRLRVLRVVRRAIDDVTVAALPPSLTELDMSYTKLTSAASFAHLTHLHTMIMRDTRLSDAALATLPPSLVSLDVSECYRLTGAAVFPALPALRVLAVNQTRLSDAAIASTPRGLVELCMADCKDVTSRADLSHLTALQVLRSTGTDLSRAVLAACRARGCTAAADGVLRGLSDNVTAMALLPDGRLVATENSPQASTWNIASTGKSKPTANAIIDDARCTALVVLPGGHVAVGVRWHGRGGGGGVLVWDTNSSDEFDESAAIDCRSEVRALALLHDGRLAVGSVGKGLQVLDVGTRAVVATLKKYKKGFVTALAVLPDGTLASASTNNNMVHLWDVGAQSRVASLAGQTCARWWCCLAACWLAVRPTRRCGCGTQRAAPVLAC